MVAQDVVRGGVVAAVHEDERLLARTVVDVASVHGPPAHDGRRLLQKYVKDGLAVAGAAVSFAQIALVARPRAPLLVAGLFVVVPRRGKVVAVLDGVRHVGVGAQVDGFRIARLRAGSRGVTFLGGRRRRCCHGILGIVVVVVAGRHCGGQ